MHKRNSSVHLTVSRVQRILSFSVSYFARNRSILVASYFSEIYILVSFKYHFEKFMETLDGTFLSLC